MGIEATGDITRYYDNLIANKTLAEDANMKNKRDITWGGTGIEDLFSF